MKYFISAGEDSGERYAARLVREIKLLDPDAEFHGLGGDLMEAEGVRLLHHVRELSAVGLVEIASGLFFFLKVLREVKNEITNGGYDAVILLDAPELNFRIGPAAKATGVPVFYYVCPQLWAWRKGRVNKVREWVTRMLVIFPFEEKFYEDRGVPATFVGHPMLDEMEPPADRDALKKELAPYGAKKLVGLLPGSRRAEVQNILPELVRAAELINATRPDVGFVIPVARHIGMATVKAAAGGRDFINLAQGRSHDVMYACDLLITKSGTSTLEAAIAGAPSFIVYRLSGLSYWVMRLLAEISYVGLPNLVAEREVAPEFLQKDFSASVLAARAVKTLGDNDLIMKMRADMAAVREKLGGKGAPARAATEIIKHIKNGEGA